MKLSARLPGILLASFMSASGAAMASPADTTTAPKKPEPAAQPNSQSITLTEAEYNLIIINRKISEQHYDKGNATSENKMLEDNLSGRLSGLDPHSQIMNVAEVEKFMQRMSSEFVGIGIEVEQGEKFITVVNPIDGSPAAAANLKPGDQITHVDNLSIEGVDINTAVSKITGQPGTTVTLRVVRDGVALPPMTIARAKIKQEAVSTRRIGDIGYIKISTFTENVAAEFENAAKKLESQSPAPLKYVMDLRRNPGGALEQSTMILDSVIDSRDKLITVHPRSIEERKIFFAKPGDILNGKPIAVMIDEGSASASELVSGTLQDLKRAKIYGRQSFGKGSVQSITAVGTMGWGLKLTVAQYFTPLQAVQGKGIMPDIYYQPLTANKSVIRRESGQNHSLSSLRPEEKLRDPEQTCSPVREDVDIATLDPALINKNSKKPDFELICVLDDLNPVPSGLTKKVPFVKPAP